MAAAASLIHIDGDRLNIPRSAFEHAGFRAWVKHEEAGLSTEPDLIFATWDAFTSGRLGFVDKKDKQGDFIELVGTPDLVVEVVSDSSVRKDRVTLKAAYFTAGIPE
jgi:Uma2 family endonuclease